jgi:hypothetical protein
VEKAGLLEQALIICDELAAQDAEEVRPRRESKKMFEERIAREGRQAEVDRERKDWLESGFSLRETQAFLVDKFQPLDGSKTCPWSTPDPWAAGRMFRRKEDYEKLLSEVDPFEAMRAKKKEVNYRWECAQWRRDERDALAKARQRCWELAASAEKATHSTSSTK